jgi:uncharacterized protein (DUF1501 family)
MGFQTSRSRREFVRAMGALLASGATSAFIPQLNVISRALAAGKSLAAGSATYRALVCVYLGGGNDSFNLLVPIDDAPYAQYKTARSGLYDAAGVLGTPTGLAIPRAQDPQNTTTLPPLLPLTLAGGGGSYGVNPYCPELQSLFNGQKLAFVANVGTLTHPLSKTEYTNNPSARPFQLFSHSDQTNLWQLGQSDPNYKFGWGGHAASFVQTLNNGNAIPALSPCISLQGANQFEIGPGVVPYQMSTAGATQLSGYYTSPNSYATALKGTLNELLALDYDALYTSEYQATLSRSVTLGTDLTTRLAASTFSPDPFVTPQLAHPPNSLADQLKMVARMIKICSDATVGIQRQIFFVSLGGFDTHTSQITSPLVALGGQGRLLQQLSEALNAFDAALSQIGMDNNVLTFTMSEFSRTLSSNGNGTDHAWGANQIIMGNTDTLGGPLIGGRIYGTYPSVVLNGSNSLDRGQMIPDTAVEQMMGTLASWMGVQSADLTSVFPNLGNFGGTLLFLS